MADESRARKLFDQIMSAEDRAAVLRKFVDDRTPESEFLEFKSADKIQEKAIKKLWSRALSGFANVEGGVLVWGIDARKQDGIDSADKLALHESPDALRQVLNDVFLQAVAPAINGVEMEAVIDSESVGAGYVVCFVPNSPQKPHRASLYENEPYFQRSRDNFIVMPHELLRSLFYPKSAPIIELTVDANHSKASSMVERIDFRAKMRNVGNASARDLYVTVRTNHRFAIHGSNEWIERIIPGERSGFDRKHLLHPGEDTSYLRVIYDLLVKDEDSRASVRGMAKYAMNAFGDEIQISLRIFALDIEPQDAEIRFNGQEVLDLKTKSRIFIPLQD